ncbi:DODA-type extradiol aromatic ring-opening family dioxygenase [Celerinatantimonas diazotrophica]|uniref:Aromatic ring-opening dioxygenase catalytic subunit (LigB family) n=1 Tax=Celerinatantimonas diazotrophica TaxID=412034 RepID=A0A4R1K100_9GAMM|nr:class III extradiol ring-cleavage dioxygenase [Celerinatantimonas diazotrophica]TCK57625.1 aromatic ring-opening dioxygenase catalytic subunit (LigB family) [Celerinatantimonas diazotrophica]CAG9298313.1 4,5-DOPA dioxygenase extradiol [Celerinatantimonas diazotrophica]
MRTLPTFFISHGGGPWPWMTEFGSTYDKLAASLRQIPASLDLQPKALLVITAHWETVDFTVSGAAKPGMLYDYYGFPDYTYQIEYPASGQPELAEQVLQLLNHKGIQASCDTQRGLDHGTFTPLAVMYPEADIPVVQLSLKTNLDIEQHYQAGQALRTLREQGVLMIGSGLSYHNLRYFDASAARPSKEFDDWLYETLMIKDAKDRHQRLSRWQQAPSARIAQPREEHLLPLWVVLGAADDGKASRIYHQNDLFGGISASSYRFD